MNLRSLPIRRALNRPTLFLGGDRELTLFSGLLAAILIVVALDWRAFLLGLVFWFVVLWLLRLMAKSDPLMRQVYLRQRRYQAYYPARSTPFRVNPRMETFKL